MKYRVNRIAPSVPTASMADIAFLLIIFFMLTTSFSLDRTSVVLPDSVNQTDVPDEAAIVALGVDGVLRFTDGVVPSYEVEGVDALGIIVQDLIELAPAQEFLIKADREVPYSDVDKILETLRNNGAKRIGLLTQRKVVPKDDEAVQEGQQ